MKVELSGIGKKYSAQWVFRGISATFPENQIHAIIGRNGSGKSTLLQIISGFITPTEGERTYADGLNLENLYQHLSLSAPYLEFSEELTALETVQTHRSFKAMLHDLDDKKMLEGVELWSHRHKPLSQLSSGMQQRLKLCLALYTDSSLLLLDEPCSNLDAHWSDWYQQTLGQVSEGRTVIIGSNSQEMELRPVNGITVDLSASLSVR